jgi:flavin-dependent dehydrogenase
MEYEFKNDVAIIGAGPAGAAMSLFLAKKGTRHALFDLAIFPRDKVCGDALSGKAVKILKQIDQQFVADMQSQKDSFLDSWGITFIAPNGEGIGNALVSAMIGAEVIETAVSRQDFSKSTFEVYDQLLYKKLWDELKLSHIMQHLGQVRWLFNLVVNRAKKSQTLRDTISCMFEDLNMRAMLRSPMFCLRLLFNL